MFDNLPVDDVEALMVELATGAKLEKTGEIVLEHLATGGKRIRARLALVAAEALEAPFAAAVPWAAACELLHNATLIHDDLQDGDEVRRGQPTAWVRHGMPSAINAGDLLLILPTLAIERVPLAPEVRWHLSRALGYEATRVIRGQVAEFDMTNSGRIDTELYFEAIDGKTSPLFELPVLGASLIAGNDAERARTVSRPFRPLGRLFQMQDDVLDLYGQKGRENPGADIREGKISALVVAHLTRFPEETDELLSVLREDRAQTSANDVMRIIRRFQEAGTLEHVLSQMKAEVDNARALLNLAGEERLAPVLNRLVDLVLEPIRHLKT